MTVIGGVNSSVTANLVYASLDPTERMSFSLKSDNSFLNMGSSLTGANGGSPAATYTGSATTRSTSLFLNGGPLSAILIDMSLLGTPGYPAYFGASISPTNARSRNFTVQPSQLTGVADSYRYLNLYLAGYAYKSLDLFLVDALNSLLLNTSTVVPFLSVKGSATVLVTSTDVLSSLSFPRTVLQPDWPREVFTPVLANFTDCLQPVPDCTRAGWINTGVRALRGCPDRVCTRAAIIVNTTFVMQCPAYGVFPGPTSY